MSNFKLKIRKKTINIKNGICLISDDAYNFDNIFQLKGFEEGFAKIVKFTIRFCRENNLKFIFPMKRYIKDDKSNELKYFKKNLDKEEFNYLIKNSYKKKFKNEYSSYQKICESNVTLGSVTTMLREALSLRKKIMVCNFTPTNIYDFPQKKFFFLKNPSYKEFKKKLKIILSLSEKKYFNSLGKNKNYLIEDSYVIDANDEVNSFINSILKKN